MWQSHALIALDLVRERSHELDRAAARARVAYEASLLRSDAEPPRPNGFRSLLARPVRAFSSATHAVSDAACVAATRIEGRTA